MFPSIGSKSRHSPRALAQNPQGGLPLAAPSRAALKALNVGFGVSVFLNQAGRAGMFVLTAGDYSAQITADTLEGIYLKANAVPSRLGAWVRSGAADKLNVKWFGAKLDGVTDDRAAIQATHDFMASAGNGLGGVIYIPGVANVGAPGLNITKNGVLIEGIGSYESAGATSILGSGLTGPVVRFRGRHQGIRNVTVSATAGRTAATKITKSNYAGLSLTRDDQNFGIWIEPIDAAQDGTVYPDDFHGVNTWVYGQPNNGWVVSGGSYGSVFDKCGANNNAHGHGIIFDDGSHTGRANITINGVLEVRTFQAYSNGGHGIAVGTPETTGVAAVRVHLFNCDCYSNATDSSARFNTYDEYIAGDNVNVLGCAFSATSTKGNVAIGGRNIYVLNTRLTTADTIIPILIMPTIGTGARATDGVVIEHCTVPSGTLTAMVDNTGGATNVSVRAWTGDGSYGTVSSGDVLSNIKQAAEVWAGSRKIQSGSIALTVGADSGAVTLTNNTTKAGRVSVPHYANAEEPAAAWFLQSDSTNNTLLVGGGTSLLNTATIIAFYTAANNITVTGTERARMDSSGNIFMAKTASDTSAVGVELLQAGFGAFTRDSNLPLLVNRKTNDGTLVSLRRDNTEQGNLTVSGTTVSLTAMTGSHWSQLEGGDRKELLPGTVMETIDQMCEWPVLRYVDHLGTEQFNEDKTPPGVAIGNTLEHSYIELVSEIVEHDATEGDETKGIEPRGAWTETIQHEVEHKVTAEIVAQKKDYLARVKISDRKGSSRVYGVFLDWDNDYELTDDLVIASLGTLYIRMPKGSALPEGGALLESNGDGCAKVQDDTVTRASTIAKVTASVVLRTFDDGSYLVPCTLHCG